MEKRAVVIISISICILLSGCSTFDNQTQSHTEASGQSVSSAGDLLEESPPPEVALSYLLDERLPKGLREVVTHNREQVFQPINTDELEAVLEKYLGDGPNAELDQRIASQVKINQLQARIV